MRVSSLCGKNTPDDDNNNNNNNNDNNSNSNSDSDSNNNNDRFLLYSFLKRSSIIFVRFNQHWQDLKAQSPQEI